MNIHAEISFYESRQPVSLVTPPWIIVDPRIIDLDRSEYAVVDPLTAAIETGAFVPQVGR
jgi:hypothetical protein